jgi:hypothetical protein
MSSSPNAAGASMSSTSVRVMAPSLRCLGMRVCRSAVGNVVSVRARGNSHPWSRRFKARYALGLLGGWLALAAPLALGTSPLGSAAVRRSSSLASRRQAALHTRAEFAKHKQGWRQSAAGRARSSMVWATLEAHHHALQVLCWTGSSMISCARPGMQQC